VPRDAQMVHSLRSPHALMDRFEAEAVPLRPRLYVAAVGLTGSSADAEDLRQETYLRAYRGFSFPRTGIGVRPCDGEDD
jgi:RNA polymerase sigma-70 factor (ECF subfamily)